MDELAGGTWLGINDAGVVAGVLNRRAEPWPRPDAALARRAATRGARPCRRGRCRSRAGATSTPAPTAPSTWSSPTIGMATGSRGWGRPLGQRFRLVEIPEGVSMLTSGELNDRSLGADRPVPAPLRGCAAARSGRRGLGRLDRPAGGPRGRAGKRPRTGDVRGDRYRVRHAVELADRPAGCGFRGIRPIWQFSDGRPGRGTVRACRTVAGAFPGRCSPARELLYLGSGRRRGPPPGRPVAGVSPMARRRRIYEGKAKVLFEGPEPGPSSSTSRTTRRHEQKTGTITGKGVLNNRISEFLMLRLGEIGVPTHFVRRLNMREQLIREVEIIPVSIVVRNIAAGSIASRFGLTEGQPLPRSIVEYYYKNGQLRSPMVAEEHITAFGWAAPHELDEMLSVSLRVNDFLTGSVPRRRHKAGRFPARVRPAVGRGAGAHRGGRRDQPRQLPPVGPVDQREDGQGPVPRRSGPGRGGLPGGRAPARRARCRAERPQGPGR